MPFLRKYGVAITAGTAYAIRIPIIKRGVVDYAVGADWTPAAGDVKLTLDSNTAGIANITTLPTAVATGNGAVWEFIFSATELQAKTILVTIVDATTKAVEDQAFIVETYGNASAMYPPDLSAANLPANVIQINGDSNAAANQAGAANAVYRGSITGATPTTTTLIDSGLTALDANAYVGRILVFKGDVTAGLALQATAITAFNQSTQQLTFNALTRAPSTGDSYVML